MADRVPARRPRRARTLRSPGVAPASLGAARVVAAVLPQLALVTGLLYYFGWARAQATFEYFGLDTGALGLSTADFILRSVPVAFGPLVGAAFVALAVSWWHLRVVARMSETRRGQDRLRVWGRRAVVVAVVLLLVVLVGLVPGTRFGGPAGVWLPLALVVGAAVLLYVEHVRSALRWSPRRSTAPIESVSRTARGLGLIVLVFLGVVWALGVYAADSGTRAAEAFSLNPTRPVVLYSAQRLALNGPGVRVVPLDQPDSKYRYQYSGLVLLARAPGKLLLLPIGWRPGAAVVFSVADGDSVRLDAR